MVVRQRDRDHAEPIEMGRVNLARGGHNFVVVILEPEAQLPGGVTAEPVGLACE